MTTSLVDKCAKLTHPMSVRAWPEIRTHLRPKMSLRPPAMANETAEATDQPPGIHKISSVSPRVWPICCRIPDGRRRPALIAGTKEIPMNLYVGLVNIRWYSIMLHEFHTTHQDSHQGRPRHMGIFRLRSGRDGIGLVRRCIRLGSCYIRLGSCCVTLGLRGSSLVTLLRGIIGRRHVRHYDISCKEAEV